MTKNTPPPPLGKGMGIEVAGKKRAIIVIDWMGDDQAIVDAARTSYHIEEKGRKRSNNGLIRHLMRRGHTSPFEMCEIKLQIDMPIFVARQWVRHRTASINEFSGRYSEMPEGCYIPKHTYNFRNEKIMENVSCSAFEAYKEIDADKEVRRMILPLNTYTRIVWKIDLHNLLKFINLRMSSYAQQEIREYAEAIWVLVCRWVPFTASAFNDYVIKSTTLNRFFMEDPVVRAVIAERAKQLLANNEITKGEYKEITDVL